MDFTLKRLWLQSFLPHYRARWRAQTEVLNYWLAKAQDEFQFSSDGVVPVAKNNCGLTLYGFKNAARDKRLLIKSRFNSRSKDSTYFRLMLDIVTRYYFPHLQPTLCPMNIQDADKHQSYMEGFHGQHREAFALLASPEISPSFTDTFIVQPSDVIIDVGAFIGFGALATSKLNYRGKTISVEADANCFTLLSQNVIANGSKVVVPVNAAIWNESGIKMNLASGGTQANSLIPEVVEDAVHNHKDQSVITKTIDDVVDEYDLKSVDMISLTINGAEPNALKGGLNTINKYRPRLRFAGWYVRNGKSVASVCKPLLEELGYQVLINQNNGVMACALEKLPS
jgi:FkbM family methyltransferase